MEKRHAFWILISHRRVSIDFIWFCSIRCKLIFPSRHRGSQNCCYCFCKSPILISVCMFITPPLVVAKNLQYLQQDSYFTTLAGPQFSGQESAGGNLGARLVVKCHFITTANSPSCIAGYKIPTFCEGGEFHWTTGRLTVWRPPSSTTICKWCVRRLCKISAKIKMGSAGSTR